MRVDRNKTDLETPVLLVCIRARPLHKGTREMIVTALLYDLRSSRVMARETFLNDDSLDVEAYVAAYLEAVQAGLAGPHHVSVAAGRAAHCIRVDDVTLLMGVCDSDDTSPDDREVIERLGAAVQARFHDRGRPALKKDFPSMFVSDVSRPVTVCFLSNPEPAEEHHTSTGIETALANLSDDTGTLIRPLRVGPYLVSVVRIPLEETLSTRRMHLPRADLFAIVVGTPAPARPQVRRFVDRVRKDLGVPLLVVPENDVALEVAREYEEQFGLVLCDSVTPRPSALIVAVLAMAGYLSVHPDLAVERYRIDLSVDRPSSIESTDRKTAGHQAFFVVEKTTGEPVFTFHYETTDCLERVPRMVAAIATFAIEGLGSGETSVFTTGEWSYALIERGELIFTLVTRASGDIEQLREEFVALPDLYFEDPPHASPEPGDFYSYHPFVLKLLAVLPPEEWPPSAAPVQTHEPDWGRFQHPLMAEFLKVVWDNCSGQRRLAKILSAGSSDMVLGALHFLGLMGAIEVRISVRADDIPVVRRRIPPRLYRLYSHLRAVASSMDGKTTVGEIARTLGIDTGVLSTVVADLCRRGYVDLL